jgi:RNA-directed DNA polymerase
MELKRSKTRITHTLNELKDEPPGFDFRGCNSPQHLVEKYHSGASTQGKLLGFKTIIKSSAKSIRNHLQKVAKVRDEHKGVPHR